MFSVGVSRAAVVLVPLLLLLPCVAAAGPLSVSLHLPTNDTFRTNHNLQSCQLLFSMCHIFLIVVIGSDEPIVHAGPRLRHRSSPLFIVACNT